MGRLRPRRHHLSTSRYFEIFDVSTTMLLERAIGMKKIQYLKAYNFLGHPVAETRAKFRRADPLRR